MRTAVAVIAAVADRAARALGENDPGIKGGAGSSRSSSSRRDMSCATPSFVMVRSDGTTTTNWTAAAADLQKAQDAFTASARLPAVTAAVDRTTTICSETAQPAQYRQPDAQADAALSAVTSDAP